MAKGMAAESELQRLARTTLGLRIEPQMAEYLRQRLAASSRPIALIGADARTGTPRRELIDPTLLLQSPNPHPDAV